MNVKRVAGAVVLVGAMVIAASCGTEEKSSSGSTEPAKSTDTSVISSELFTTGGTWEAPEISIDAADLDCRTPAANPTRGITATTIKVGGLITKTGPTTSLFGDAETGARARFERANAEGGVNGRTIDFIGAQDDGLESTRQVDGARKLVNQDVFAVVPVASPITAFNTTFCDASVPYFGWGITTSWCDNAVGFGITGCLVTPSKTYNSSAVGSLATVLEGTDKTIAIIANEDEAAKLSIIKTTEGLERAGIEVVYSESILSATTPLTDPSSIVNSIMTSNHGEPPAMVYQVTDFANTSTITQALTAAGYEGKLVGSVGYDPRLATFEAFDESYTVTQWAPFEATDVPFVDQMNQDFAQYAPDGNKGVVSASGYIAADMFLAAVEAAGPDLTVDKFLTTLNDGWTYSVPHFKGDTTFPLNHVIGVPCSDLVQLKDQVFSLVVPITCSTPFVR